MVVVTPAEADFHLLLPCVLLHAAARIPETDPGFVMSCMCTGRISTAAARIWADLEESQQPGHTVQAEHCEAISGLEVRFCKPWLMAIMPPEVVADVLPFLLDILGVLQQQLQVLSAVSSSMLAAVYGGKNPAEQDQRSALGHLTAFLCYVLLYSTTQQQRSAQPWQQDEAERQTGASLAPAAAAVALLPLQLLSKSCDPTSLKSFSAWRALCA